MALPNARPIIARICYPDGARIRGAAALWPSSPVDLWDRAGHGCPGATSPSDQVLGTPGLAPVAEARARHTRRVCSSCPVPLGLAVRRVLASRHTEGRLELAAALVRGLEKQVGRNGAEAAENWHRTLMRRARPASPSGEAVGVEAR